MKKSALGYAAWHSEEKDRPWRKDAFLEILVTTLRQFETEINSGAVVVVDEFHAKARLLPVR